MFECIRCLCTSYSVRNLMDDMQGYCNCNACGTHQKVHKEVKKEIEHLYTPADVKRVKDRLAKEQNGIDPILKEPFKETQVCDHDHTTQHVRAALNRNSNAFEGKVWNSYIRCLKWLTDKPLPEILRNLAEYYERDYSHNPLHPGFIKRLCTDYSSLNEQGKKEILHLMGQPQGANGAERKKLFRSAILSKKFTYEQVKQMINERKKV